MDKYIYLVTQDNLFKLIDFAKDHDIEITSLVIIIIPTIEFVDDSTFRLPIKEAPSYQYVSYFDGDYDLYYVQLFSNENYVYFGDEATSFMYDDRYQDYKTTK